MERTSKKLARCAIYTRKSTEHNLDLEFNSLDAQREACEAYIKSQAHEGWRLIPQHYDDGAFSGASLERPALQSLLAEIRSGRIDIIVVYKVDRLTRSLADFAKLVELFDQHSVSFVSVTQSFNTTSSMGRLTLNMLLSFAQFEREVIGERVRDKIAASKRKGIWVGGPIPRGYKSVDKKLVIVPEKAELVRMIFTRYLELGSIGALARDLDRRGIQTLRRKCDSGPAGVAVPYSVGGLMHLLRNRFYVGEVVYRGKVSRGDHEAIIVPELFDAVQAKLAAAAVTRTTQLRGSPAILTGRIFDDRGNRMTPTHTNKRGVRYRYYISHVILQNRPADAGSVTRVPAPDIEAAVIEGVKRQLTLTGASLDLVSDHELIERHVARVTLKSGAIEIQLNDRDGDVTNEKNEAATGEHGPPLNLRGDTVGEQLPLLTLPWSPESFTAVKGVLHDPAPTRTLKPETAHTILEAIAKARTWIDDIVQGRVASFAEIARREGKVERHIRVLAPLAFVSPAIVSAISEGTAEPTLTVTDLARAQPYLWAKQ